MTPIKEIMARLTPQQLDILQTYEELFKQLDQTALEALQTVTACRVYFWGTRLHTPDELLARLDELSADLLMTLQAIKGLTEPKQQ